LTATAAQQAAARVPAREETSAAVSVQGVDKRFKLPHNRFNTLKQRALHPFATRAYDVLQALEDVSFEVAPGEFFGIVGRNGSGKSTLLKCLAGIYSLDGGEVRVAGRLSPFIELGVGFNAELTARDNVLVNAVMLGLTRRQARERFDDIVAFAGLEEFVDLKLKNYSSGMSVRLGFSVAIQVDADVLLVDEVLAVGDASFQQKCFEAFHRMKGEGRTVLYVTHDMTSVRRFCDRAMLIERGRVLEMGDPEDISRSYGEINFGHTAHGDAQAEDAPARVTDGWCESSEGERVVAIAQGERCVACMEVELTAGARDPVFAITFRNDARHTIFVAASDMSEPRTGSFPPGERVRVRFEFENWLAPSRYTLTPSVAEGDIPLGSREDVAAVIVHGSKVTGGVADLPTELDVVRL
jgi:ABC-type polysaccharide/polyol phosphate transport system ATPase subunit